MALRMLAVPLRGLTGVCRMRAACVPVLQVHTSSLLRAASTSSPSSPSSPSSSSSPSPSQRFRSRGQTPAPLTNRTLTELQVTETMEMRKARPLPAGHNKFLHVVFEGKRVVKVTRGGRQASMSATVVVGNMMGAVGYGSGKGEDLQQAVDKAAIKAMRNVTFVPRFDNRTIYHTVHGKDGATTVHLRPTRPGKGVKCHRGIMAILRLAGITDVNGNAIGVTTNMPNLIRATLKALQSQAPAERMADALGKSVVLLHNEEQAPVILSKPTSAAQKDPIDYLAMPKQQRAYVDWQFTFPRTPSYENLKQARLVLDQYEADGQWSSSKEVEDIVAWLKKRPTKLFGINDDILDPKIFAFDPSYSKSLVANKNL